MTLNYDYTNYSFSNPVRFGNVPPWNTVQRYGVSVLGCCRFQRHFVKV